jgi:putative thioredoxin
MADVTDAIFERDVIERSKTVPVVVDLWAPWCGPCKQIGPIIEKVIAATGGKVELAKVNVDENPQISQAFEVQSIPAVFALSNGAVVDQFIGAKGEAEVAAFVAGLTTEEPPSEIEQLLAVGDEASLNKVLELEADNVDAVMGLAVIYIDTDRSDDVDDLLAKIPETAESRHLAALARTGGAGAGDDVEAKLNALLDRIPADDEARQEFVDLLEVLGPDDPRIGEFRRRLSAKLF